ncbi:unnamed protein product [Periconia digitata]|uniref:Gfd2/YDR514C-like C-terminal domain-containing protein n=1 Tax=Periconia digitata TaxID=1303443 RepID=A0A9W4U832_9PLEO|nr:unnamed protein product [Periconia digitata]
MPSPVSATPLPDRTITPQPVPESVSASDDDNSGGVPLSADDLASSILGNQAKQSPDLSPSSTPGQAPTKGNTKPLPATINPNNVRRVLWKTGAPSSSNPGSMPKPPASSVKLPPTTLVQSQLAKEESFAPILALAKYPYKYCSRDNSQDVASAFFDAGKFWARDWDLYYVWDIEESKPLILVGESQFSHLLQEINTALDLSLRITDYQQEEGLVGRFPDHPRCQPRYLGRSHSREEYNNLTNSVPNTMARPAGEALPPSMADRTLEDFKEMIEDMWEQTKAKNKATKERKKVERLAKQRMFADQFKRAQRYLGLRQIRQPNDVPGIPAAIDVTVPAPFPCDKSVIFICVDVESYEKAHHLITEVGIATLDTRDLSGIPPGNDGKNWRPLIRARHFRIQEYSHLVNSEYVSGCPDRFDFGRSEWVRLADAAAMTAECFKEPFCGTNWAGTSDMKLEERNLIFLGHDAQGDIRYLQTLGFDAMALPNMLETQDTATMYRVWRRELNPTNLGRILYSFDIPGFNLHNAGNDAVFTVQAMLAICVREASIRDSPELKTIRAEERQAKASALMEEAKLRTQDEAEGWSENEADGDGGEPVKTILQPKQPFPAFYPPQPNYQVDGTHEIGSGGRGARGGRGRGGGDRMGGGQVSTIRKDGHDITGQFAEMSVQNNRRANQNRGQGQGRGRGRGRGGNGPGSSSSPNYGFQEAEQKPQYFW